MGFVVTKGSVVLVDHETTNYCETRPEKNPSSARTKCQVSPMVVHSVFKRLEFAGVGEQAGDNCPFIYAVKGKKGLVVHRRSVALLARSLNLILDTFHAQQVAKGIDYDLIIPMPSSHPVASILARRVGQRFVRADVLRHVFTKTQSADVRHQLRGVPDRKARLVIMNIVREAESGGCSFSMGDVPTRFRKYLSPLSLRRTIQGASRILLVDDLFASGATLIAAKDALLSDNPELSIDALCLFSPYRGRIHRQ